jgi:ABC-type sugar transport system permease subunit
MNVFTTDHPLCSDPSHCRNHSALERVLGLALVICPFMLGLFAFLNLADDQETTGYSPDPFWDVFWCAVIYSLLVALVIVALGRLFACLLPQLRHGLGRNESRGT